MTAENKELMKECEAKRTECDTQIYKNRLMIEALEKTLKQMDPLIEYEDWEERFDRLSALLKDQKKLVLKRQRIHSLICDWEREEELAEQGRGPWVYED